MEKIKKIVTAKRLSKNARVYLKVNCACAGVTQPKLNFLYVFDVTPVAAVGPDWEIVEWCKRWLSKTDDRNDFTYFCGGQ